MEIFFGISFIILAAFLFALICAFSKEDESAFPCAILGALIIVFVIGGTVILENYCNPSIKPIDVYRGKTTLEITYRDSVAVDSVVVWKEEQK